MTLSSIDRRINEGQAFTYTATLKDSAEVALAQADITTITLTLYNLADGSIINSRTAQDVNNVNEVTIHATSGLLTWSALAADAVISDDTIEADKTETHVALFEFAYGTGLGGTHEFVHYIKKLTNV
tara:strand:- start:20222 stop:20602 length:381 start_codon:yes stop_codon:yes gene_type:complete